VASELIDGSPHALQAAGDNARRFPGNQSDKCGDQAVFGDVLAAFFLTQEVRDSDDTFIASSRV
jgi:hypothetical protein